MKKIILLTIVLFVLNSLMAQEKQVAMDNSGKVTVIDRKLEIKLKMFTEYEGFKEARLYETGENSYILEITYQPESTPLRVKKEMDEAMVLAFRDQVSNTIKLRSPNALIDQEGRTTFLIGSTLIGTTYYGAALGSILDLSSDNMATTSLLTAGAGFFVPYLLTTNKEFTMGEAAMAFYGQSRGILHGVLIPTIFDPETDYRLTLGMGLVGSIAETLMGYNWAKKHKLSEGQALATSIYSDFGMGIAFGASATLGLFEDNEVGPRLAALSVLVGGAGGFYLGSKLARKDYYTSGDALVLSGAGFLGAYIPVSLLSVTQTESYNLYGAVGTLGAIGGLMIGDRIVKKHDFSVRQGVYIYLSELAGGLVGMGLGFAVGSSIDNVSALTVMTGLGALAGYALTTRHFMKEINKEDSNLSFNMSLNPMGLLSMTGNAKTITGPQGAPILMGSIRF